MTRLELIPPRRLRRTTTLAIAVSTLLFAVAMTAAGLLLINMG